MRIPTSRLNVPKYNCSPSLPGPIGHSRRFDLHARLSDRFEQRLKSSLRKVWVRSRTDNNPINHVACRHIEIRIAIQNCLHIWDDCGFAWSETLKGHFLMRLRQYQSPFTLSHERGMLDRRSHISEDGHENVLFGDGTVKPFSSSSLASELASSSPR
jgi:hypothetical protein